MKPRVEQLLAGTDALGLNGSFENVLPGSHTTAITQNNNNGDLNSQFPGWLTIRARRRRASLKRSTFATVMLTR